MKKCIISLIVVLLCLVSAAAADAISLHPGPFQFSLQADSDTTAISLYGDAMDISGEYDGQPFLLSVSFHPQNLGVAEAWEPVIGGLHVIPGSQTVESSFSAEAGYSIDFRILKDKTLYSGSLSVGCATGYMELQCSFIQAEYSVYQALLLHIRDTLQIDPAFVPDDTVYVWIAGEYGKKYHCKPTCSDMKNPIKITLDEAIERGIEPCQKCY